MHEQIVFSPKVFGMLEDRGFHYVRKQRNFKEPDRWVYFFTITPEFSTAYKKIMDSLHQ